MALRNARRALLDLTLAASASNERTIGDATHRIALTDLERSTNVAIPLDSLRNRAVLLLTERQLPTVLGLLALDGIAGRVLLGLPDLKEPDLSQVIIDGEVDFVLRDDALSSTLTADPRAPHAREVDTEWILFTSGTMGRPKMVLHTLASLVGPLDDGLAMNGQPVWSTFYDIRRYGGLQILLRALLGGGSMVLSSSEETVGDLLTRMGRCVATHISGTPSHWRRALMSQAISCICPDYIRLSGEISDQALLDNLRAAFPRSDVAHAFASTEAGVGFDVRDGLAGFPAHYIDMPSAKAELKVAEGTLRVRSARTAVRYLGTGAAALAGRSGFVDTGDMVERRGDRYYFLGRREGVINVGGQKVHPEEIEAVLNRHHAVRVSRVWARKSPIMGAVVAADIVLADPAAEFTEVRESVLKSCRAVLSAYKVPVTLRPVASLAVASSGKLSRRDG
jgi:acyl-CoA synthetase (AMP-forming)/AMP-acid ligase II